ncbi:WcaI family glycosyltransferase [Thermoleptolyngbya oregonensis NK1-22]|uniref:WcaI family glycosyltransferase n=1 Tax=Thermoleptolyngbya oregonensis NK1-22 TaxID=2547457 RepID=A0AA97BBZ2_9CYAN|nr:WcaI family glycosyltransferase [Thermoleptolyngbya oregonensis]WOB42384.1 WcaI family glycosyltransferase [Thermoleptolyngbya oregonensis NK1-22]
MRILIYSYNYSPEPIGIAPLMTELAEGLVQRGHEVRVVTGMPNYPQRRIYPGYRGRLYQTRVENGVRVQRCYVWIRPRPGLLGRVLLDGSFVITSVVQALWGFRPDVILLTTPPLPVSVPAALLGKIYRCPVVLNVQDILPEAAVRLGIVKNRLAIRAFEALERFAYRTATAIAVIADGFAQNLINKGVSPQKLTCIPNWVDVNFIRPMPPAENRFRQQHGLQEKFIVLYAGNIALTQGMETVVEAASLLRDLPDLIVAIVGEREACQQLQDYARQCHAENVQFFDFQPREQLPHLMAAADVGLVVQRKNVVSFNMPSKFQLLLASGCPVVASAPMEGELAKLVLHSEAGTVVQPEQPEQLAETLRSVYHDAPQRVAWAHQGRQYALQHYRFEQAIAAYEQLFHSLTGSTEPGTAAIALPPPPTATPLAAPLPNGSSPSSVPSSPPSSTSNSSTANGSMPSGSTSNSPTSSTEPARRQSQR